MAIQSTSNTTFKSTLSTLKGLKKFKKKNSKSHSLTSKLIPIKKKIKFKLLKQLIINPNQIKPNQWDKEIELVIGNWNTKLHKYA